jgi:hypothetical protein
MKTLKHLYPQTCVFENLYWALRNARKGKGHLTSVVGHSLDGWGRAQRMPRNRVFV